MGQGTWQNGAGAQLRGGRFTRTGGPRAVYLSTDIETVLAERQTGLRRYGLQVPIGAASARPTRTIVLASVSDTLVLDVTTQAFEDAIRPEADLFRNRWWLPNGEDGLAYTQLFGSMALAAGFGGVIYRSVANGAPVGPNHHNLVLFTQRKHVLWPIGYQDYDETLPEGTPPGANGELGGPPRTTTFFRWETLPERVAPN